MSKSAKREAAKRGASLTPEAETSKKLKEADEKAKEWFAALSAEERLAIAKGARDTSPLKPAGDLAPAEKPEKVTTTAESTTSATSPLKPAGDLNPAEKPEKATKPEPKPATIKKPAAPKPAPKKSVSLEELLKGSTLECSEKVLLVLLVDKDGSVKRLTSVEEIAECLPH